MKLIVGLGNPGRKYEQTRHNVGFVAAAKIAQQIGAASAKDRFEAEFAEGLIGTEKVGIMCPQTFMNSSGRSVRKAMEFYKLSQEDLLVLGDDMNLPVGRIRMRPSGSAGGQKGLADIIRQLGSEEFARLRIGIGRPPTGWEVVDYVLGKLAGDEAIEIDLATSRAAQAAADWVRQGVQHVMNQYNAASS